MDLDSDLCIFEVKFLEEEEEYGNANVRSADEKAVPQKTPSCGILENKRRQFTKPEKKQLLGIMRTRGQIIYDKTHRDHKRRRAVEKVWREISAEMHRSVAECKLAWKSLRDSERYHCQKRKKTNTGSACNLKDADPLDDSEEEWEFADDMSFFKAASSQRIAFSSSRLCSGSADTDETATALDNAASDSNEPSPVNVEPATSHENAVSQKTTTCGISKKKKCQLIKPEKKKLLGIMRTRGQIIYDKTRRDHKNRWAVEKVWREISAEMNKSVAECKLGWRSLRDSARYHCRKRNKAKTGSACNLEDADPSDDSEEEWEFADDMSFVKPASSQRIAFPSSRLFSGSADTDETATAVDNAASDSNEPSPVNIETATSNYSSNYSYASTSSRQKCKNQDLSEAVGKVTQQMEVLVQLQKEKAEKSKFGPLLALVDSILQQVPDQNINAVTKAMVDFSVQLANKFK